MLDDVNFRYSVPVLSTGTEYSVNEYVTWCIRGAAMRSLLFRESAGDERRSLGESLGTQSSNAITTAPGLRRDALEIAKTLPRIKTPRGGIRSTLDRALSGRARILRRDTSPTVIVVRVE